MERKRPSNALRLKKEVDIAALELLLSLNASLRHAVAGAAMANHRELIINLIQRGAEPDFAVFGAACKENVELYTNLIDEYKSITV